MPVFPVNFEPLSRWKSIGTPDEYKENAKVNNGKYKGYFHKKAKMLTREEVNALIGHDVGGVCPFSIRDGVDVYLDVSLKRFDKVYPACSSANSAVELTPDELYMLSGCREWIDVCKIPEE